MNIYLRPFAMRFVHYWNVFPPPPFSSLWWWWWWYVCSIVLYTRERPDDPDFLALSRVYFFFVKIRGRGHRGFELERERGKKRPFARRLCECLSAVFSLLLLFLMSCVCFCFFSHTLVPTARGGILVELLGCFFPKPCDLLT